MRNISFAESGSFLQTEIGAIRLKSQSAPMLRQRTADYSEIHRHGFGLSNDKKWITRDSEKCYGSRPTTDRQPRQEQHCQ